MIEFKPTPHFNPKDGKFRRQGVSKHVVLFFQLQPIIFSILIMLMYFEIIPLAVSVWISPIIQVCIVILSILLLAGSHQLVFKEKLFDKNLTRKDLLTFKNSWELYSAMFTLFWIFMIGWGFVLCIYSIAISCILILRIVVSYKILRNKQIDV